MLESNYAEYMTADEIQLIDQLNCGVVFRQAPNGDVNGWTVFDEQEGRYLDHVIKQGDYYICQDRSERHFSSVVDAIVAIWELRLSTCAYMDWPVVEWHHGSTGV